MSIDVVGRRGQSTRVRRTALTAVLATLVLTGGTHAQTHEHDGGYADLSRANAEQRAKARALLRAVQRAAPRFATVARGARRGYVLSQHSRRPALVHMRKHGFSFWGRVLDPRNPQALVFWCPSRGRCRLIAFMYRAPWQGRRPTFGGIVDWHNHHPGRSWMTHVFLARSLHAAFATCVPFNALEANLGPFYEPYRSGWRNRPCDDTIHLQPPHRRLMGGGVPHEQARRSRLRL